MGGTTGDINIGDWSEVYVFFRILGERVIHACDENLNKTGTTFPVLKITKAKNKDSSIVCRYNPLIDTWDVFEGGAEIIQIESKEGTEHADALLLSLQNKKEAGLNVYKALKFLNRLHIDTIKSASTNKEDIILKIGDARAGTDPTCGFSIKSYLGQPPTLLNSSKDCTNFLYEVTGVSTKEINDFNNIPETKDLLQTLRDRGADFNFEAACSSVFASNLESIDTNAERIIGEILKIYYTEDKRSIAEATDELMKQNPLQLRKVDTYKLVIKRLLEVVSLGMTPGKEWNGLTDNTSGIIIVKPDGDVVTYHVYNRDAFKQYLYLSTMFEKPSRKRHQYAKLFEENGKVYIKFALQVRFKRFTGK